jgi:hypothetical protein
MLVTRRRLLKRAALWIAAPAIVRASSLMPVKAEPEWTLHECMMHYRAILRDLPPPYFHDPAWGGGEQASQFEWIGSSVFYTDPPPLGASVGDVFDHFAKVTGFGSTDRQARLSDDKKGPIRASVGKASHDRQIGSRRALIWERQESMTDDVSKLKEEILTLRKDRDAWADLASRQSKQAYKCWPSFSSFESCTRS